jgi:hypothetical protein
MRVLMQKGAQTGTVVDVPDAEGQNLLASGDAVAASDEPPAVPETPEPPADGAPDEPEPPKAKAPKVKATPKKRTTKRRRG